MPNQDRSSASGPNDPDETDEEALRRIGVGARKAPPSMTSNPQNSVLHIANAIDNGDLRVALNGLKRPDPMLNLWLCQTSWPGSSMHHVDGDPLTIPINWIWLSYGMQPIERDWVWSPTYRVFFEVVADQLRPRVHRADEWIARKTGPPSDAKGLHWEYAWLKMMGQYANEPREELLTIIMGSSDNRPPWIPNRLRGHQPEAPVDDSETRPKGSSTGGKADNSGDSKPKPPKYFRMLGV